MRKVVISRPGGYERLGIEETDAPIPGPGEVLIDSAACGVNFADCCVRMGVYRPAKVYVGWPITPGFEVAGSVAALGEGVADLSVGDRVVAVTRFGGYASQLCVLAQRVFKLPDSMDYVVAASLPTIYLTAYYALHHLAAAQAGQRLLVHSAAGGVGSALVQLAKRAGCEVVAVVGAGHKQVPDADCVIDKSTQPLWRDIGEFDAVFDANGAETLRQSYEHLAPGGRLIIYGFHTMLPKSRGRVNWLKAAWDTIRTPRFSPLKMTTENRSVMGFNLAYQFDKMDLLREDLGQILSWVDSGAIKAPVITTYALDKVAAAHRDLESGSTVGKLVLLT